MGKMSQAASQPPSAISPAQCRAARAFFAWPRHELAARAGVSLLTVVNFESEKNEPRDETMQAIVDAFTFVGIEFLGGVRPGLRFNPAKRRAGRSRHARRALTGTSDV
jgi:DNA-binding XRE family transcriptional regulator